MKKIVFFTLIISLFTTMAFIFFINKPSSDASPSSNSTESKASMPEAIGPIDIIPLPSANLISDALATPEIDKKIPATKRDIYTYIVPEYGCTQIEYDVFNKINEYRIKNKLTKVEWSSELYSAATIRSKELTSNLSHTRPDGSSCFSLSKSICSENLAYGYSTADTVFNGWVNSKGHRENILTAHNKTVAISLYKTNTGYKYYWINVFGY